LETMQVETTEALSYVSDLSTKCSEREAFRGRNLDIKWIVVLFLDGLVLIHSVRSTGTWYIKSIEDV
jgi:hypothetical protein